MRPMRLERFVPVVEHIELQRSARRTRRHAALALIGVAAFGLLAAALLGGGLDAGDQFAIADDPVRIADRGLDRNFDGATAAREIHAALDSGDADLAQSFLDLARDRGVAVDP